jgi:hypothetical protein
MIYAHDFLEEEPEHDSHFVNICNPIRVKCFLFPLFFYLQSCFHTVKNAELHQQTRISIILSSQVSLHLILLCSLILSVTFCICCCFIWMWCWLLKCKLTDQGLSPLCVSLFHLFNSLSHEFHSCMNHDRSGRFEKSCRNQQSLKIFSFSSLHSMVFFVVFVL